MTIHLSLNEEQFRTLVRGGIVEDSATVGNDERRVTFVVKLILSDIGFDRMQRALDEARRAVATGDGPAGTNKKRGWMGARSESDLGD